MSAPLTLPSSSAVHSRYECKYLVPERIVSEIQRLVAPFLSPDSNAQESAGLYPISSLYLDSPDLLLLRMGLEGWSQRFKLRARTYSDRPEAPVFLEIKSRSDGVVRKQRARVERPLAERLLGTRRTETGATPDSAAAIAEAQEFLRLSASNAAGPVLLIRYLRQAYEARDGSSLRLTFDTEVAYAWSLSGQLQREPEAWRRLPLPVLEMGAEAGAILEIKFTDWMPTWVHELISRFDLVRGSVSKYSLAMKQALKTQPAPLLAGSAAAGNTGPLRPLPPLLRD